MKVDLFGDGKFRPGVVLRLTEQGLVVILSGTRTRRDHYEHLTFEPHTVEGKILGLDATTHFYLSDVHIVVPERLKPLGRRCSPRLMLMLEEFAAKAVRTRR